MKQKKKRIITSFFLAGILLVSSRSVLNVEAGASSIVTDNSSFKEELDTSLWNNSDRDVLIQDGVLVFPNESTDTTSLISKTIARSSDKYEELVHADLTMQLMQIPEGQKFVLAFGLASIDAVLGEAGNVEIAFINDGGLKVSVSAFDDSGSEVVISQPAACGKIGNTIKVYASISTAGVLALKVDGKVICEKELPVSGEGRFGFLQSGSCGARINSVEIVSYEYDTPENCNVFEDFESGTINVNALTSKMVFGAQGYAPSKTFIHEIDGNKVFYLQNCGVMYLGSVYQYSNFEITFDVPYLQRAHELDEDGNIITPKNENFAVSFGDETADYNDNGYVNSADLLIFTGSSKVVSWNTKKDADMAAKGYPVLAEECNRGFSVKVSVIDSVITVGVKWMDEEQFTDVMEYQISGRTPTGYVHIWTTANVANMAIDNLRIENKDENPNLIEVEYRSGLIEAPADFAYQPMERIYREKENVEETFNPWLIIPAVAGGCVLLFGAALLIMTIKEKKKRKGESLDGKA